MFCKLINCLKPFASGLFPDPPTKPNYPNEKYEYSTKAWGSHSDGNYVMAYIPKLKECEVPQRPKAVIYLHGFALGNPYFYDAHMQHLAKQGYYVFFADYQKDNYPDTQAPEPPPIQPGQDIRELLQAVIKTFPETGADMIKTAYNAVNSAMKSVFCESQIANVDVYLFGHSVGGLFSISWPCYVGPDGAKNIKAIVAADPITETAKLPPWLIQILDIKSPFLNCPVRATHTGAALNNIPVAVLIGNSDLFVKPLAWKKIWSSLATVKKTMYISQSDYYYNIYRCDAEMALIAYHNQSVTNTMIENISQNSQLIIGGAGIENNMRWRFIWSAFDQVLQGTSVDNLKFKMGQWSNGKNVAGVKSWTAPVTKK
jgi:dienelactone hydrolase